MAPTGHITLGFSERSSCTLVLTGVLTLVWLPWTLPAFATVVTDRIVAVVNSEVIMMSELKSELAPEQARLRGRYQGEELQRRLQQIEYIGLSRMIERRLQIQQAKKHGHTVSDSEVDQAIAEMRRQGIQTDTLDSHERRQIKEQLILMKVVDREVRSLVMVSEAEFKRYYEQHQPRFLLPAEYRISQILIKSKAGESEADTRKRAMDLHTQAVNGADFAALVTLHSDGAEAGRGGSLGFVRQGELMTALERVIAGLGLGEISEPVQTAQGFHILRLDEKKPPQYRPFAEVKNEIQTIVFQQKTEDVFQDWLTGLKDKAYIEVKL